MTCKVCGADLSGAPCPRCGFDPSLDYEEYPTLTKTDAAPSLAAQREEWEQRGKAVFRCPECGKTSFSILLSSRSVVCRGCGSTWFQSDMVRQAAQHPEKDTTAAPVRPVSWQFDESTGCLTVSGSGDMPDDLSTRWDPLRGKILSVDIQAGVKGIAPNAFKSCVKLRQVSLADSVTGIGHDAFRGCSALAQIALPDSVCEIGDNAFAECSRLKSVSLPSGITQIKGGVFYSCKNLERVVIPENVTSILFYAFYACFMLKSITLPHSVTKIEPLAFGGCRNLETVYYGGSPAQWHTLLFDQAEDELRSAKVIFTS